MNRESTAAETTASSQDRASDPRASAWVSANAGSGKTYVLSRRVIRLLLAGAEPAKILCLTFTKAAAAEMARRVFDLLSKWTDCDEDSLRADLAALEGEAPDEAAMIRARRLFALALETPGGLKIQTIHAFCEALLQRFPLEANVPGHFRVLDDREQQMVMDQARTTVFAGLADHADPRLRSAFGVLIGDCSDFQIGKILGEIIAQRQALHDWIAAAGGLEAAIAELFRIHRLQPTDSPEAIDEETVRSPHFSPVYVQRCMQVLAGGGTTDRDTGTRMTAFFACAEGVEKARLWRMVFTTQSGDWRKTPRIITNAIAERLSDFRHRAELELERLQALEERRRALAAIRVTAAFMAVGTAVVAAYHRAKTSRGLLDFEDLIVAALDLLSKAEAAPWVQFKLDQGIDHILVDEAQDTSPRQWAIVRALAEEFFTGESARPVRRTLFAVGDVKQSIYSFQGAEPRYFSQMRTHFAERARAAAETFHPIALRLSFRSTADVLSAVDAVFADAETAEGVAGDGEPILHDAVRGSDPGEVAVWPLFADQPASVPDDWSLPIDVDNPQSARIRLAEAVAGRIAGWLAEGMVLAGQDRPLHAGDILVLVRKRDGFVAALVRALKSRDIAVAGSDRLVLTDHIAVKDLIALGRVMVLREDDLSLAALLKSPLFEWSEEDLLAIAHDRRGSLWDSLCAGAAGNPVAGGTRDRLEGFMAVADFERPFEFFARILDREGGREAFKRRFGNEVDDVLDQFLLLALEIEDGAPPSLDRFVWTLESSDLEIKRELDATRSEIRIMTVHGAKGLEAPIVFLVDPGSAPRHTSHDPAVIALERPHQPAVPALSVTQTALGKPAAVAARIEENRRAGEQEYRRLLYVALTRARDRLVVCGYHGTRGAHDRCWHTIVWRALAPRALQRPFDDEGRTMLVWRAATAEADAARPASTAPPPVAAAEAELPAWAHRPAATAETVSRLSPSLADPEPGSAAGPEITPRDLFAEALAPEGLALKRGRLVHRLLEVLPDLPPDQRAERALRAAARAMPELEAADRERLVADTLGLLDDPRFASVFTQRGKAEVALSGSVRTADGRRHLVSGQVDRLVIGEDAITIVDYKTNRDPPESIADAPANYVAQLALYRALLTTIYPGHRVAAALVWTAAPALMPVPAAAMDAALERLQGGS